MASKSIPHSQSVKFKKGCSFFLLVLLILLVPLVCFTTTRITILLCILDQNDRAQSPHLPIVVFSLVLAALETDEE